MRQKSKLSNNSIPKNLFLFLLSFVTIAIGCRKDIYNKQHDEQINLLKNWYSQHSSSFNSSSKTFARLKPDFNSAYTSVIKGLNVTEINFEKPNSIIFTAGIIDDKAKEKLRANTEIKLILFNTHKTLDVSGAYMVSVATDGNLVNVHYQNFKGFNGTIRYYNLDGSFENGYQILNGKIEKILSKLNSLNANLMDLNNAKAMKIAKQSGKYGEKLMLFNANGGCNIATITEYGWQCVSINNHPDIPVICSLTQGDTETYMVCEGGGVGNDIGGGGYTGTGGTGTQGGGGGSIAGTLTMPPPPETPISDMKKFLSCFDKNQSANLTVYAEKTTTTSPGHAFIEIKQGNNTMIFGFYPKNSFPSNVSGPGVMGENGGHYYDGKWNIGTISAEKIEQIISLSINYSLSDYGLAYNNCADFTLGVLAISGITNNSSGIDGPNTILNLMPASANTSGNAPQTQRTCP